MRIKGNRLKWLGAALVVILGYQGCCRVFEIEDRKWLQTKTGLRWPSGTHDIHVFEMPGCIRTHWIEAFLILPKDSLDTILKEHFTAFDPRYARGWYECEQDQLNWETWKAQSGVFGNTNEPLRFFISRGKLPSRRILLGPGIYFASGDKTGSNSFKMVVDSASGDMWIHVNYPE